jgi:hypothetical protein
MDIAGSTEISYYTQNLFFGVVNRFFDDSILGRQKPGESLHIEHFKDISSRHEQLCLWKGRVGPEINCKTSADRKEGAMRRTFRDKCVQNTHVSSCACESPEHNCLSLFFAVSLLQIKIHTPP